MTLDVAPHGGAWIETYNQRRTVMMNYVAPHGGAWIETVYQVKPDIKTARRPSRRGVD